jgi:hypothetical protein
MTFDFGKDISSMTDEEILGHLRMLGLEDKIQPASFRQKWEEFKNRDEGSSRDENDVAFFQGQILLLGSGKEKEANHLFMLYTLQIFDDLLGTLIYTCAKLYGDFPVLINIAAINDRRHPEHLEQSTKFYILSTELLSHIHGARFLALIQAYLDSILLGIKEAFEDDPDFPVEHPALYNNHILTNFGLKILQSMRKLALFNKHIYTEEKLKAGVPANEIEYMVSMEEQQGAMLINVDEHLKKLASALITKQK